MKPIAITLPDGSQKSFPIGVTALQIAASIGKRLEKDTLAAKVDGKLVDANFAIEKDARVEVVTRKSDEGLEIIRHSTAHLLAHAVKELYPETQVTIGPVTADGFYYDFYREKKFVPEDLAKIEARMSEITKRNYDVSRKEWNKEDVIQIFKEMGEDYKVKIIQDISEPVFSTYQQGEFIDLCRGPHVPNLSKLGKFKLLSIAGAYWRGDENNEMLQRIYGTAFATQNELDEHLHRLEEAKKRDHRKLAPEMELFTFLPIAPAMPFYLPKGAILADVLQSYMRREMSDRGYQEVICPQLMSIDLWKKSGHLEHFKDNMFFIDDEHSQPMALKPMNCPGHVTLFGSKRHSYRELPIRLAEFSRLHRNERAGVTHGIFRVRTFSQDDAHIFCTEEQLKSEALSVIDHTYQIYKTFGFEDVEVKLATRDPNNFMGEIENWEKATKALEESLKEAKMPFGIAEGEAAFYGPKIEFHIRDSLKRSWQCGTVQVDFNLPQRFGLEYVDSDGGSRRPVMVHRAILGSLERFLGILIEHYAGHLPLWVAPVQVVLINVNSDQESYAQEIHAKLREMGVRAEIDLRNEKLGYKIREAQLKKVPLMLITGPKEAENKTLSVRESSGKLHNDLSFESFEAFLKPKLKPGG